MSTCAAGGGAAPGRTSPAPWFDDGSLGVHIARRYYWQDAAAAHGEVAKGHTRGKLVLIVDDDLAAEMEV